MSSDELDKENSCLKEPTEISSDKTFKIFLNFLLSTLSIVVVFGFAEFVTRALGGGAKKTVSIERPREFYLPQQALTMRGNLVRDPGKTENYFNIAVVGDSFTFGSGLQTYDTFSSRLAWMLNLGENKRRVDVVNYGTPGASTRDEVALVDKAVASGANLVILEITLNDAQEQSLRKELDDFKIPRSLGAVLNQSKLLRLLQLRIHNSSTVQKYIDYHNSLFENPRTLEIFLESLDRIKSATSGKEVPLVAVIFPLIDFPIDKDYPFAALHLKIGEFLKARQIPFYDLKKDFEGLDPKRIQLAPGSDSHPNEIGHRIAAESIYRWIVKEKLIPEFKATSRIYKKRAGVFEAHKKSGASASLFLRKTDATGFSPEQK